VLSPATDAGADGSIDAFTLLNYIRKELEKNNKKLDGCMPNPFAGTKSIEKIKATPDKMRALTTVIQFIHHYKNNL